MLTIGPLTRRAEDLMPVVQLISGPDGQDARCEEISLGDPAAVGFEGRRVLVPDDASIVPPRRERRTARDRAADALADAGARVETVSLKQLRRALELYLAVLGDGADVALSELVGDTGARTGPRGFVDALRGRGPHTPVLLITMGAERANRYMPRGRIRKAIAAARSLEREVDELLGDGLLLHHPFARVAPRHNRTVGRPWVITAAAAFNLLGLPVTQVPLGLNRRGLPLGVQVAARHGNDHLTIAAALDLERRFGGWRNPQLQRPRATTSR
jgi:fatty acid amide hydrolase 2